MLIVNADDWGGWKQATDAALGGLEKGTITSVTAMVFCQDSERAASIASHRDIDVGLHLNLDTPIAATAPCFAQQQRVRRFLRRSKYAQLIYNPLLRAAFRDTFRAQWEEFVRLYKRPPSHVDGHHHMHLCLNMLLDDVIPQGEKVRRSFSFGRSERGFLNRAFRSFATERLRRRYKVTDFFFSLQTCLERGELERVAKLARAATVELMTHPENPAEREFLLSARWAEVFRAVELIGYSAF